MLVGNQMEKAFCACGVKPNNRRKSHLKKFKCRSCGEFMIQHDGDNFMYCVNPDCKNDTQYFIFDK